MPSILGLPTKEEIENFEKILNKSVEGFTCTQMPVKNQAKFQAIHTELSNLYAGQHPNRYIHSRNEPLFDIPNMIKSLNDDPSGPWKTIVLGHLADAQALLIKLKAAADPQNSPLSPGNLGLID